MKTLTTTISLLLLLSFSFFSCKKDRNVQTENSLVGDWQELGLSEISRSVKFTKDNSFLLSIGYNNGGSTRFIGTYKIQGDSIKVFTTEMLEQLPGKAVQRTHTNYSFYENATFSIVGDTLKLKHTTYPADAPVNTIANFRRMVMID